MSSNIVRWGGLAGLAAEVMFLLSGILAFIAAPEGVRSSFSAYLLEAVVVVAFVLALLTLAGVHVAQRNSGRYGILGEAGFWLTFLGYVIVVIAHLVVLAGGEATLSVPLVGALLVLVGSILLGAMTIRARVLPWWCGVLLMVGFPLGDVLNNFAQGSENIVFAIVWGSIGYALLSRGDTVAEQATPHHLVSTFFMSPPLRIWGRSYHAHATIPYTLVNKYWSAAYKITQLKASRSPRHRSRPRRRKASWW